MASIFTRIINGEIPCYKVAESKECYAFLDINPLAVGHTLVIPKKEVDYLFDIDDDLYNTLFTFTKQVGKAIESVIECKRIGLIVFGLDVPHAHIHLIPINKASDMSFSSPKLSLPAEKFKEIAEQISNAFENQ